MKLGSNFKLCWKKRNMIRKYSFSSARWQKKQGIMIPSSSSHLSGWPTISRFLSLKIRRPTKFIQFRNVVRPFFEALKLWNVRSGCCLRPAVHADGSRQNGLVAGLFGKIEKKSNEIQGWVGGEGEKIIALHILTFSSFSSSSFFSYFVAEVAALKVFIWVVNLWCWRPLLLLRLLYQRDRDWCGVSGGSGGGRSMHARANDLIYIRHLFMQWDAMRFSWT